MKRDTLKHKCGYSHFLLIVLHLSTVNLYNQPLRGVYTTEGMTELPVACWGRLAISPHHQSALLNEVVESRTEWKTKPLTQTTQNDVPIAKWHQRQTKILHNPDILRAYSYNRHKSSPEVYGFQGEELGEYIACLYIFSPSSSWAVVPWHKFNNPFCKG